MKFKLHHIQIGLLLILFILYNGIQKNTPNNYDDNVYPLSTVIQDYKEVQTSESLKRIFTEPLGYGYAPLVFVTYLIEANVYGTEYYNNWYRDNLLLYLLFAFLIIKLFHHLGLRDLYLIGASAIFLFSPLKAESVVWLTERKDLLLGIFFIASFNSYIAYRTKKLNKYIVFSLIFFLLALLSKIQAVTLPLVILAYELLVLRTKPFKIPKINVLYFAFSLAIGLVGIYFLRQLDVINITEDTNFSRDLFLGLSSFGIYEIKTFIPYELIPLYRFPETITIQYYIGFIMFLLSICSGIWLYKKKKYTLLFGLLFYVVNIIFMLQIIRAGNTHLANRYTFISSFGLVFMLFYFLQQKNIKKGFLISIVASLSVVFIYMVTIEKSKWTSNETVAKAITDKYPKYSRIWNDLLSYHIHNQNIDGYNNTLANIKKNGAYNYITDFNQAKFYLATGNNSKYREYVLKAYAQEKNDIQLMFDYSNVLTQDGKHQEVVDLFENYLKKHPNAKYENIYNGLAQTYLYNLGNREKAIYYINKGLEIHPYSKRLKEIQSTL